MKFNKIALKQAFISSTSFAVFFILIKMVISFFSNKGYQPMLNDLFAEGRWQKTLFTILLGWIIYGVFMYYPINRKMKNGK